MMTFGTDPEFLLVDKNENVKSAIGVVDGTTEHPIQKDGCNFYYDNVLAECTVVPGKNKEDTLNNIRNALRLYSEIVKPYKLKTQASAVFPPSEMMHEHARIAGCNPDTCAYTLDLVEAPKELFKKENLRSCGGHIHLGEKEVCKTDEGPEPIFVIYMLDLFVGIPSLFIDKDPTSPMRRSLYGQAGRFRKKEYGVEYRSLSNFWLQSPTFASFIHDLCSFAVDFVESGKVKEYWSFDEESFFDEDKEPYEAFTCKGYDPEVLRRAINDSDKNLARPLLRLAKSHLPSTLSSKITSLSRTRPKDLYKEWNL